MIWRLGIAWPTPQPRRQVNGTKCAPHFDTGLEAPRLHSFLHQLICPKPVFAACLAPSAASARWIWSFLPRHPGCSENTTSNFMTSGTAGCQHQRCRCVKSYLFCSLIFLWRKPSIYKVHLFSHSLDPNTHKTHQISISCWPSMACSGGCKMLQTYIKSLCPSHPPMHARHPCTALRHSEKHHVWPSFLCVWWCPIISGLRITVERIRNATLWRLDLRFLRPDWIWNIINPFSILHTNHKCPVNLS